ncbi:molybdopterin-guanine dinucleotide biosynthesis protein B [Crenobacter cavernae]|uniref:Molybdopterin-guanine dinucleotide biosynthesis protein B n=1 Tax=Crenobacter cavernae TaxID=2290923 RepID=A0ABY0F9B7_9NEIS|nr:molybdopterin-guanine dinucleotide biosynthesis protein B [Crenobacter cavernae]RXZ42074.1 molybdopterin-guanine dinucleotide biosynthesis protein B [Crenobacter cavernae]
MKILAISGYSGCGKTTLITRLIPLLKAAGLSVAVIKHTHHDVEWDAPGKDSYRHREAGARQVMLVTPTMRFSAEPLAEADAVPLIAHVAALSPCDLVLAEGFKHEPVPRIEVYDAALNKPWLYPEDSRVLALASDTDPVTHLPCFPRDATDDIARFILDWFHHAKLS